MMKKMWIASLGVLALCLLMAFGAVAAGDVGDELITLDGVMYSIREGVAFIEGFDENVDKRDRVAHPVIEGVPLDEDVLYELIHGEVTTGITNGIEMLASYRIPPGSKALTVQSFAFAKVRELYLPDDLEALDEYAFYRYYIDQVHISASLRYIDENALVETYIDTGFQVHPDNKEYMSIEGVLYSKDGKELIHYPEGKIEREGIVHINDKVERIANRAIRNRYAVSAFSVAEDNAAFQAIDGVLFTKDGKRLVHFPSKNAPSHYAIPTHTEEIAAEAFSEANIESIVIPPSIETIPQFAFLSCYALRSVALPITLQRIENGAFYDCLALENIVIPPNVHFVDEDAFYNCPKLLLDMEALGDKVGGEDRPKPSDNDAFDGSVYIIADGKTNIAIDYFEIDEKINRIETPDSLIAIGRHALRYATVGTLHVSKSVRYIDLSTLYGANEIGSIEVDKDNPYYASQNGVLHSKDGAEILYYPSALLAPEGVLFVGDDVTDICCMRFSELTEHIKRFSVDANNDIYQDIDGVLYSKDGKMLLAYPPNCDAESYRIKPGTEIIAHAAFENSKLVTVEMPSSVKVVEANAFTGSATLASISLPNGLQEIGDWAFGDCRLLERVFIPASVKKIGRYIVDAPPDQHIVFHVVEGSLAKAYAEEHSIPYAFAEETKP